MESISFPVDGGLATVTTPDGRTIRGQFLEVDETPLAVDYPRCEIESLARDLADLSSASYGVASAMQEMGLARIWIEEKQANQLESAIDQIRFALGFFADVAEPEPNIEHRRDGVVSFCDRYTSNLLGVAE